MAKNPYENYANKELILRDELAIDRTLLANERTLLAYLRSALALVIVGITFLHFFEAGMLFYVGILFIPCGIAVGTFGAMRYRKMDQAIRFVRASADRQAKERETEKGIT